MSSTSSQPSEAALQELRKLLFEQESARIDELEKLLLNQEQHAQEVAKVLAEAVRIRNLRDEDLGKSLAPTIEKSIKESIARDPKALSDALFPVMGPAIRKSIQNAIAEMLQSLNQTLENSFSAQGLKWRFEAMRTNKSFAEVVMLNTLVYRVEQVFLIHKETGLLLHHISFDPALNEDADVISSMLTAVQDFIQDSFSGSTEQGIENLRMGDLEVILESSPDVVLAVVCRGNTPRSFNEKIQTCIEHVQQLYGKAFKDFDGNTEAFLGIDEHLQPLLVQDFKRGASEGKKKSPLKAVLAVSIVMVALAIWWGSAINQEINASRHWDAFIEKLQNTPGIIITDIKDSNDSVVISGLRDPLTVDPYTLLNDFSINKQVAFHMQPYHALQDSIILKRVTHMIKPPTSIQLNMHNGILSISGEAPKTWLLQAKSKASYIAGINDIDTKNYKEETATSLEDPLTRAISFLQPPSTVTLTFMNGTLYISGKAPKSWLQNVSKRYSQIKGVNNLRTQNFVVQGE